MSVRLVILGLLMEGDKHPYEISQVMKERVMDHYIKLPKGSLYYAITQLEKKEYIKVIETVRECNRPEKTIYRITEAGREEFQRLLIQQFTSSERRYHPLYAALAFAKLGDPLQIAEMLRIQMEEIKAGVEGMERIYEEHIPQVSRVILHMMMGIIEIGRAEIKWLDRVREDALAGQLSEVGEPLDLTDKA
ncbi:transcriptional regulator, PadR family [Marininema mesophilum]|uniref:Transcriptional regulator, PadR family n=1 Tax=Marininema mesophilum TaxID=1048340 RepID=A0A1H2UV91_9BACL|nr:PadR family transcriptional regulator [Marininema mesophilum]SDW60033.1 transcriptional regulator, PadR family [Marininema mesophilum]